MSASGVPATADVPAPVRQTLLIGSVMLATVLQIIDTTIANVALPHMQGSLSANQDQISWVLTSYIVAAAIMTPPTGWLAARYGRKKMYLVCVAGFTAASVLCGLSLSLQELVLFRILQGMFGAGLVPLSQATLLDAYPRERHGQAMALWGVGIMIGPILGPTLGGYLTEFYNWRWVFFINLPLGLLAFTGILAAVPATEGIKRPFDFTGFALLSLAIGALQLMLDRGEGQDWFASSEILIEAALAGLGLYMYVIYATMARHPFVELGMLRDRNFASSLIFIFLLAAILYSSLLLLPPFLQNLMGYPVFTAGLVLAPRGIGTMISMIIVGRLLGRVDARPMMLVGLLLIAVTMWRMSGWTTQVSSSEVVWTGVIQGLGLGQIFVPLSTLAFATLPQKQRTEAASLFSLLRNIGGSIGISVMVTMLSRFSQINHATIGAHITAYNPVLHSHDFPAAWNIATVRGRMLLDAEIGRQASTIAFLNDFRFLMWVSLAAIPLLLLLKTPPRSDAVRDTGTEEAAPQPAE